MCEEAAAVSACAVTAAATQELRHASALQDQLLGLHHHTTQAKVPEWCLPAAVAAVFVVAAAVHSGAVACSVGGVAAEVCECYDGGVAAEVCECCAAQTHALVCLRGRVQSVPGGCVGDTARGW